MFDIPVAGAKTPLAIALAAIAGVISGYDVLDILYHGFRDTGHHSFIFT